MLSRGSRCAGTLLLSRWARGPGRAPGRRSVQLGRGAVCCCENDGHGPGAGEGPGRPPRTKEGQGRGKLSDDPQLRKILDEVRRDMEQDRDQDQLRENNDHQALQPSLSDRYRPFSDKDAQLILDVHELESMQRAKYANPDKDGGDDDDREFYSIYHERERDRLEGATLERGVTGVFDVEELVDVLRRENARDVCVVEIPERYRYADHMVVVTAKSPRHVLALAEFMRKMYKAKKGVKDPFLYPEGNKTNDWHILDMGNIVLHIFQALTRENYDLETLWTVGPKYDTLLQRPAGDPVQILLDTFEWENLAADGSAMSVPAGKSIPQL